MDINSPINYPFPYRWDSDGMPGRPVVNRLMKAIIEENISEMYSLVRNGASILLLEQGTLGRVLYYKITNYDIAKFFVDCGARGYFDGFDNAMYNECYDDYGYTCGGTALAYYRNAKDVFKLLAENGFDKTSLCFDGADLIDLLDLIKQNDDADSLLVLLENGFSRRDIEWAMRNSSANRCKTLLANNPVIHRKTAALESNLTSAIPEPHLKTPKFLHKKENDILIADYKDRLDARKRLLDSLSPKDRKRVWLR